VKEDGIHLGEEYAISERDRRARATGVIRRRDQAMRKGRIKNDSEE
jgi:hypothetical protein